MSICQKCPINLELLSKLTIILDHNWSYTLITLLFSGLSMSSSKNASNGLYFLNTSSYITVRFCCALLPERFKKETHQSVGNAPLDLGRMGWLGRPTDRQFVFIALIYCLEPEPISSAVRMSALPFRLVRLLDGRPATVSQPISLACAHLRRRRALPPRQYNDADVLSFVSAVFLL